MTKKQTRKMPDCETLQDGEVQDIPAQFRQARFMPDTIDAEERTVELIWTTGARVMRMDFWSGERFEEELSLEAGHVDLSRLNNGAPLLNSHRQGDLSNVLGVVESASIDGEKEGRAVVRFSDREDVEPIFNDVRKGIIRNVSVGYVVRKFEIEKREGSVPLFRAVDWQPFELSMVAVCADMDAGVRASEDRPKTPCAFVNRASAHDDQPRERNIDMTKKKDQAAETPHAEDTVETRSAENTNPAPVEAQGRQPAVDENRIRRQAAEEERARVRDIRQAVRALDMEDSVAEDFIEQGTGIDQVRARLLEMHAEQSAGGQVQNHTRVEVNGDHDERAFLRQHMHEALIHRARPDDNDVSEGARQYRGMTLVEMARECLEVSGQRTRGWTHDEIVRAAMGFRGGGYHAISDFPEILANTANKALRQAYEATQRSFTAFARRATLNDFKQVSRAQLGSPATLEKVTENGEIKSVTVGETAEKYSLGTFANSFGISREAIINDDLNAFDRIPRMFGAAAANLQNDVVYGILTANAAMADGVALFHANHSNLLTGSALDVANLGKAREAMRKQKGIAPGRKIGKNASAARIRVNPRTVIVPEALLTDAEKLLNINLTPDVVSNANPFTSRMQVVSDPRLDDDDANAWYVAADPNEIDTIEYAFLSGQEGVQIESQPSWKTLGIEFRAWLDFAAKAIDHRGLAKNPGA